MCCLLFFACNFLSSRSLEDYLSIHPKHHFEGRSKYCWDAVLGRIENAISMHNSDTGTDRCLFNRPASMYTPEEVLRVELHMARRAQINSRLLQWVSQGQEAMPYPTTRNSPRKAAGLEAVSLKNRELQMEQTLLVKSLLYEQRATRSIMTEVRDAVNEYLSK